MQLGKSSPQESSLRDPSALAHAYRPWLQEERQPGASCRVSSDKDYCMESCCKRLLDNLKLRHHNFVQYTFAATARLLLLAYGGVLAENKLMSGSMGGAMCGHP